MPHVSQTASIMLSSQSGLVVILEGNRSNTAGGTDNVTVVVAHFRDAKRQQAVQQAKEQAPVNQESAVGVRERAETATC